MKELSKRCFWLLFVLISLLSCEKDKKPRELLPGDYKLTAASINNEDVFGLLKNDTINLGRIIISTEEGYYKFLIFISPEDGFDYIYSSSYLLIKNNTALYLKAGYWNGVPDYFLNDNRAILPFSQQDYVTLGIEKLSEKELILNTVYSGNSYRYEFENLHY